MKTKCNPYIQLLLILFNLQLYYCFSFKEAKVIPTITTTNVVTTYTITLDRTQTNSFSTTSWATSPLNSTSTITVSFPTQYALTNSVTCSYQINGVGSYTSTSCNQNGNQITLSGIFTNGMLVSGAIVVVNNVLNPFPAGKTAAFSASIGIDLAVANNKDSIVTITPAVGQGTFTFYQSIVYSPANMIFTITTINQFPLGGSISIKFPGRTWTQQLDSTRTLPITDTMTCQSKSANVNTVLLCTGSFALSTVTINNVVTSTLPASSTISFAVNNFISPPTNQQADNVVVTTMISSSSIDQFNTYVTGLVAKQIPSSQFSIVEKDYNVMKVNQLYTIKFDITPLNVWSSLDVITISFPSEVTLNNFNYVNVGGSFSFYPNSTFYNNLLTLYLNQGGVVQSAAQFFINIVNFKAPPSTLTTGIFTLTISSYGFARMYSQQTLKVSNDILEGSATNVIKTINQVSTYTFTITLSNAITSSGFIKIIFPAILSFSVTNNSNCGSITGINIIGTMKCVTDSFQNSIRIMEFNSSSSLISSQPVTINIAGVKNPPTTATTSPFLITTYYTSSLDSSVDVGSLLGVTSTPSTIDSNKVVISSSSLVTSAKIVTYYLSFVVGDAIPKSGTVQLYFPSSIVFDLLITNGNCQIASNSGTPVNTPCTGVLSSPSYIFTFTNPFPSSAAAVETNLTFYIPGATNPSTTVAVSPFSIYTYDSDGSSISNMLSSKTYALTTPSDFLFNTVTRLSSKNGDLTTYSIKLTQVADLQANAIIKVNLPSLISPLVSSKCSIDTGTVTNVACTPNGNIFTITSIGNIIPKNVSFVISITNIRNPYSYAPLTGFTTNTKSSLDTYFYSSGVSNTTFVNDAPSSFSNVSYKFSPLQLDSSITLTINFQLSQFIVTPTYLQFTLDPYFIVSTLSCSAFIDFSATCSILAPNTIKVNAGFFNSSTMSFTISGFSSKKTPPTSVAYSTLNSFETTGYKIDQSSDLITFALQCALPCKTCNNSITPPICLSCYQDTNITFSIFYHLATRYCYTTCPPTTYNNQTLISCQSCDSNCYTCSSSPTFCTACLVGGAFPFLNIVNTTVQICVASCDSGFYPNSAVSPAICSPCKTPCATCSSQNTCITCKSGFYYITTGTCSDTCPANTTIADNSTKKCQPCSPQCLTCASTIVTCTSCNSSLLLYNGRCLTECPSGGSLAPNNGKCQPCASTCFTCSKLINNCTSCNGSLSLYLNGCVSNCTSGFAAISNVCQPCTNNCKTCQNSTAICLTCNNGTYMLTSSKSCVSNCGNGLFADFTSQTCIGCTDPCKTCTNTTDTCLSCNTGVLFSNRCIDQCNNGYFELNGTCYVCPSNCSTCVATSNCTACSGAYLLYNGRCISSCPSTHPVISGGACTACSVQNCFTCTAADACLSCKSPNYFLKGKCFATCPSGYVNNATHCVQVLEASLKSNDFPVPFSIAGVVLVIACLMSRLQFNQTYISGAIYSFLGVLEWLSLLYFIYLYYKDYFSDTPIPLFICLGGLGYLYIMNFVSCVAQNIFLCYEKQFIDWKNKSGFHKCFFYFSNVLSLIANHKFRNILFCKLFTFKIFSAKLDKVQHFRIFNIFSLLSLVHSGAAIFGCAVALSKVTQNTQVYYECIDVIVLTSVNALMAFFNTHKDKKFFQQYTPQGYSLHKKNNLDQDYGIAKIQVMGRDGEIEERFLNDYNHALVSKQALNFQRKNSFSSSNSIQYYSDNSIASMVQKQYQQISIQAVDMIDQKANITAKNNELNKPIPTYQQISIQVEQLINDTKDKGLNISQLPVNQQNSNFTRYSLFDKVDQSVQGKELTKVNRSIQRSFNNVDYSVQQDQLIKQKVDVSVQQYERGVDYSVQNTPLHNMKDFSIQQENQQGVDQSVQLENEGVDQSIQQDLIYGVDQSVQYDQVDKRDVSIQPTVKYADQSISMTNRMKSISVQQAAILSDKAFSAYKASEQKFGAQMIDQGIQPSQQSRLEGQQIAIQYEQVQDMNYNELEQSINESNQNENVIYEEQQEIQDKKQRNLKVQEQQRLQIEPDRIGDNKQDLKDRIRKTQKEIEQMKRKMMIKQKIRMQERKQRSKINENNKSLQDGSSFSRTIQEIKVANKQQQIQQNVPNFVRSKQFKKTQPFNKQKQLRYQEYQNSIQSQSQQNVVIQGSNILQKNNSKQNSNNGSVATKKITASKPNIPVDIIEVDQYLDGDQQQFQQSMNDKQLNNKSGAQTQNKYRNYSPQSDLQGTIEQIPRHYNSRTISEAQNKIYKPVNKEVKTSRRNKEEDTYITGSISVAYKNQPKQQQKFRINKFYNNNNNNINVSQAPLLKHNKSQKPTQKNSTLALAGRSQLGQTGVNKKSIKNNPLDSTKKWQAQNEDKFISEDDSRSYGRPQQNNRTYLMKNINQNKNFTSNLILPQQTDQQQTSFKNNQKQGQLQRLKSSKIQKSIKKNEPNQIQVHFQADQIQHQMPISLKHQYPPQPKTNRLQSSFNGDQSEDIQYRRMMLLNQMQERPKNDDLQEYYRRKRNSKEKQRKSTSKVNKSTQKIYTQKMDKTRK